MNSYEVLYYSGDELPRTQDLGGAQSGRTGLAGGKEAHHRTQTIHVARGKSMQGVSLTLLTSNFLFRRRRVRELARG